MADGSDQRDAVKASRMETILDLDFAQALQRGTMDYRYRGIPTLKCPFDLAIYQELIWDLKPATILEFGSYKGGSALWLADLLRAYGFDKTRLITLDIQAMHEFRDPRVEFVKCDVNNIAASLSDKLMSQLAHPFLVIEDSSHKGPHVRKVMDFFHKHSRPGDYLIVEDGVISLIMDEAEFDGGPLSAIHGFMADHAGSYEIDRKRCDRYGKNVTWNPDGYIRRIK